MEAVVIRTCFFSAYRQASTASSCDHLARIPGVQMPAHRHESVCSALRLSSMSLKHICFGQRNRFCWPAHLIPPALEVQPRAISSLLPLFDTAVSSVVDAPDLLREQDRGIGNKADPAADTAAYFQRPVLPRVR